MALRGVGSMLIIRYEHCDTVWFDLYGRACDSECPECGDDIEALAWCEVEALWDAAEIHWQLQECL